jgi:hypothetical protein
MGHADLSVTYGYDKGAEDNIYSLNCSKQAGLGFKLSPL